MKMKLSTRHILSPGRLEKFPPPLMRFLRTNASRRSRGSRSRANPIFIKQRTFGTAPVVAPDMKEPSSPKVTCMGQVRVRRSKQGPRKQGRPKKRRCRWIPRILFCRGSKCGVRVRFSLFQGSNCCTLGWPKWGSFFRSGPWGGGSGKWGFGSRGEDFRDRMQDAVEEDEDDGDLEGKGNRLGSSPCSPPKNALILTRCRSAPYTSSSLACQFWGSPFETEKTEHRQSTEKTEHRLSTEKTEHRLSTEKTEHRLSTEKTEHRLSTEKTEHRLSTEKTEHRLSTEKTEYRLSTEKMEHRLSTEKTERANWRLVEDGGEQSEMDPSHEYSQDGEPAVGMFEDREATNSEGTRGSIGDEDDTAAKSKNGKGMQMWDGDMEAEAAAVRPLMLTRCKSEPARPGEKLLLDPEVAGGRRGWESSILVLHVHCD